MGSKLSRRTQMNRSLCLASGLALGVALAASGCYVRAQGPEPAYAGQAPVGDATAYPSTPPPDPIPEAQPPAPGYGYDWINGYWDWTGYDWTWDAGYWAPQGAGYLYVGPRFLFVDGRPVFYRSYWQGPGGARTFGYGFRGSPPGMAFRAHASVAPGAWRAQPIHNQGWQRTPGAGGWRGAPARGAPMGRAEPMRGEPPRGAPMRANQGFHAPPARAAPAGGGRRRR
jgi:hypothetical protein